MNKDKNQMKRTVIDTEDNSKTLLIDNTDITYHSRHGAMTESIHIFIKNGLEQINGKNEISVFEMGLGTGLNAILSLDFAITNNIKINYHSIEKFPVTEEELAAFNISSFLPDHLVLPFNQIHETEWNQTHQINKNFTFKKQQDDIKTTTLNNNAYDIVFFDAFGPKFQPELWQQPILKKMFNCLKPNGTLMTYCAQGQFKRDLKQTHFIVENLAGPPGKREITRAIKP